MPSSSKFRRLTDGLSRREVLVPHLERALVTRGEHAWPEEYPIRIYNKERVHDGYFHPSSHAGAAELQLYYEFHPEFRAERGAPSPELLMLFQVGSAYHALVQSMLIELGFTTKEEVEVGFRNEKRHCSGTLDIRRLTLPNEKVVPVEIKSTGFMPKEPPLGYLQQFQIYMDLGDDEPQEEGLMLFLEKSSPHRFREFTIHRDEEMLKDIYKRWARVLEAIDFSKPDMLTYPCHVVDSKAHKECSARFVCRLGPPTGERRPTFHA